MLWTAVATKTGWRFATTDEEIVRKEAERHAAVQGLDLKVDMVISEQDDAVWNAACDALGAQEEAGEIEPLKGAVCPTCEREILTTDPNIKQKIEDAEKPKVP